MSALQSFQNFVNNFGLGISKEKLVSRAYSWLEREGYNCCILNGRYLIVDNTSYQLIKSKKTDSWVVKEF